MKEIYSALAATLLLTASASAAPARFALRSTDFSTRHAAAMQASPFERLHRSAAAAIKKEYKPQLESYYFYERGRWVLDTTTSYDYNDAGQLITAESDDGDATYRITYTYDAFGMQTGYTQELSSDGGKTWTPEQRRQINFDSVVHDFALDNYRYSYYNDAWSLDYAHRRDVSRNSAGAVTAVDLMLLDYGNTEADGSPAFTPTKYSRVSFDEAAPTVPVQWSFFELMQNQSTKELYWLESTRFSDIVWERTDGQMLSFDEIDYKTGANRISSCNILDEGIYPSTMTVEYPGGIDYHSLIVSHAEGFEGSVDETLTSLDAYGSQRMRRVTTGNEGGSTYVMVMQTEYLYDTHGNLTKEEASLTTDGIIEDYLCTEYANTYDEQGALTSILTTLYDDASDSMQQLERIDYSDFRAFDVPAASISGIDSPAGASLTPDGRSLAITADGAWQLSLCDISGKTVATIAGSGNSRTELTELAAGVYIAVLRNGSTCATAKLAIR